MKNFILVLTVLTASCGAQKHASSELNTAASPSQTPEATLEPQDESGRTDHEIFFNAKYTGYQPALSGESIGEPCSVFLLYGVGDIARKDNHFTVVVDDLGQTPLSIDLWEGGVLWYPYFDYKKGKTGKHSFREYRGKTTIEWNERQIVKVESTRTPSLLERWETGKGNETIVCQNLTRVK